MTLEAIVRTQAADEAGVRERLIRHVRERTTDFAAAGGYIAPEVYTDSKRWEAEQREIFLREPLLACLSCEIPDPEDMIVFDSAGPSILIVRAKDGSVNAFLNMCMHRGARLVEDCAHGSRLTCPFHAWTYTLDGKLIGVPRKDAFDPQDLATRNLMRVPVGEWGGMVFVKAHSGDERIDVAAHLGSFAPILQRLDLANSVPIKKARLDFGSNWKFALDTYGEVYHLGILHAETVGDLFYGDLMTLDQFERHHRYSMAPKDFAQTINEPERDWSGLEFSPIYFIWPNVVINPHPMEGGFFVQIHRIFGETVDKGFSTLATFRPDVECDAAAFEARHDLIAHVVGNEDYMISAAGHRNLKHAPPGFKSVLGRNETPALNVQNLIAEAIGMPLPA